MNTFPFMVDFSYWNNAHTITSLTKLRDWGMRAAVARGGFGITEDSTINTLVGLFRGIQVPYGLYWYLYPGLSAKEQVAAFVATLRKYPDVSSCFFLDLEEYKAINGMTYSKSSLEAFYKECYTRLSEALPNKKIGVYTANWCVSTFFPKVVEWIPKTNGWYADYIKYYDWWQTYISSLGGSWADNTKPISISNLPNILKEIKKRQPHLPQGITNWGIWQCVTFIPFKELTWGQRNLDYNILTTAAWKYWFDIVVEDEVTPPQAENAYKVLATSLRVRSGPGLGYDIIGQLHFGTIVNVTEIKSGWGKSGTGWCSMSYLQKVEVTVPVPPPVIPPTPVSLFKIKVLETMFIRESPGTLYGKIGYATLGQTLTVIREVDGWYKLDTEGWVSSYSRYSVKL